MWRYGIPGAFVLALGFLSMGQYQDCGGTTSGDCVCGDTGAYLVVVSGCENWQDATECSGWHSCLEEQGQDPNVAWTSGTTVSCFDNSCEIRLICN